MPEAVLPPPASSLADPSQVPSEGAAARLAAAQQANAAYMWSNTPAGIAYYTDLRAQQQAQLARPGYDPNERIRIYDTTGLSDPRNQQGVARDVTRAEYFQIYGMTPEQSEEQKHMRAFHPAEYLGTTMGALQGMTLSQIASRYGSDIADYVQDYSRTHPSAAYLAITQQYEAQRYSTVSPSGVTARYDYGPKNPYPEDTAAGIAWLVGRQQGRAGSGIISESLARTAAAEGYTGEMRFTSGISTVPIHDISSAAGLPLTLSGTKVVAGQPSAYTTGGITTFVPYGEYRQIALENTKIAIDYTTGEIGIYQYRPQSGTYGLIGGGGRAAAQSGMFTVEKPYTAWVVSQESGGSQLNLKYAQAAEAGAIMASPESYSRLGAEAYAGYVRPLDARVLTEKDALSRYGDQYNLANYVDPFGVNLGKAAAPGAAIPWSVSPTSPTIQYMTEKGLTGQAVIIPGVTDVKAATVLAGATPAPAFPAPFRSTSAPAVAATAYEPVSLGEIPGRLFNMVLRTPGFMWEGMTGQNPAAATMVGMVTGVPEAKGATLAEAGLARVATESEIMKMIQPTQKVLPEWMGYEIKAMSQRPATIEEITRMIAPTQRPATEAEILQYLGKGPGQVLEAGAAVALAAPQVVTRFYRGPTGQVSSESVAIPAPYKSTYQPNIESAPSTRIQSDSYFGDISTGISKAPVLSWVYQAGESAGPTFGARVSSFVKGAPVLESIYSGGGVFELKSDYERLATRTEASISPALTVYQTGISAYERNLSDYNTELAAYNANMTTAGYYSLSYKKAGLEAQKASLDFQRASIEKTMSPVKEAERRYQEAAAGITGRVDQKSLITYGAGTFFGDIAKGYEDTIVSPIRAGTSGWGHVGGFITGVAEVPGQIAGIGQAGLIGGETIVRNIPSAPGIAAAGVAMQIKGTYEMATTSPAELLGNIVGMAVIGAGAKAAVGRGLGIARTQGMDYVPIEDIGYDTRMGFAIGKPTEAGLRASFETGTLEPAPTRMSLERWAPQRTADFPYVQLRTSEVPYIPGQGGRPFARLPGQQGETVLWTAHEYSTLTRGIERGEAYRIATPGSSEVQGVYGASVAMSYFAKVGGQIPRMIGFDMPVKSPVIYSTTVEGLEAAPRWLSRQTMRNVATGTEGAYDAMNAYLQGAAAQRPGSLAFMPLTKSEYEAVIIQNSIVEVTGRRYYTKLGGFGESHFLGTRVPIVEQQVLGFEPAPESLVSNIRQRISSEEYTGGSPVFTPGTIALATAPSTRAASIQTPSGSWLRESERIAARYEPAYQYPGISVSEQGASYRMAREVPSYKISDTSVSRAATRVSEVSGEPYYVSPGSSFISPRESLFTPTYKYTPDYSIPREPSIISREYRISDLITPPYTPPITGPYPVYTPPYTPPPYSPGPTTPYTPPYTPPPTPPFTPLLTPSGISGSSGPGFGIPRGWSRFIERLSFSIESGMFNVKAPREPRLPRTTKAPARRSTSRRSR